MVKETYEDVWDVLVKDGYCLVGFRAAQIRGPGPRGLLVGWYCCQVFNKGGELCGMGAGAEISGAMEEAVMAAGEKAGLVDQQKPGEKDTCGG